MYVYTQRLTNYRNSLQRRGIPHHRKVSCYFPRSSLPARATIRRQLSYDRFLRSDDLIIRSSDDLLKFPYLRKDFSKGYHTYADDERARDTVGDRIIKTALG